MTTADMLDNDDVRELLEFLAHDNRQGDAVFEEAEAGQEAGGAHRKVSTDTLNDFAIGWKAHSQTKSSDGWSSSAMLISNSGTPVG
jgi:hypothetical protein